MTETSILWLFGTVIGLQTAVIGGIVAAISQHSRDCRDFRATLAGSVADIKSKLDRVERDIGTHETGIRGQIHKLRGEITPFVVWAQMQQQITTQARELRDLSSQR
jgi:hypothetical protein